MNCCMSDKYAAKMGSSGRAPSAGSPCQTVWDCTVTEPSAAGADTRRKACCKAGTAFTSLLRPCLLLSRNAGRSAAATVAVDRRETCCTSAEVASAGDDIPVELPGTSPASAQWSSSDLGRAVRPVAGGGCRGAGTHWLSWHAEQLTPRRANAIATTNASLNGSHCVSIVTKIRNFCVAAQATPRRSQTLTWHSTSDPTRQAGCTTSTCRWNHCCHGWSWWGGALGSWRLARERRSQIPLHASMQSGQQASPEESCWQMKAQTQSFQPQEYRQTSEIRSQTTTDPSYGAHPVHFAVVVWSSLLVTACDITFTTRCR